MYLQNKYFESFFNFAKELLISALKSSEEKFGYDMIPYS